MNFLPNLIIVGAAKSGTTTLFNHLKENPDIFIPEIKECRFFSQMPRKFNGGEAAKFQNEGPRDIDSYIKLFKNGKDKYLIDISNDYFYYYEKSIKNIKNTYKEFNYPEPKILIILRNPIKRVFSMYHHIIRLNSDNLSFEDCFNKSSERIKNNYAWMFDLKGFGLSFEGCKAYMDNFKDVKVLLFDEFKTDSIIESIYSFLDLELKNKKSISEISNRNNYISPKNLTFNLLLSKIKIILKNKKYIFNDKESFFYKKSKGLYEFLNRLNSSNKKSKLTQKQKDMLINYFEDDVSKLSKLLKKDLKHWLY